MLPPEPFTCARFQGDRDYFHSLAHDGMGDRAAFEARVEMMFSPYRDADGNECVSVETGFSCKPESLESAMAEVAAATQARREQGLIN